MNTINTTAFENLDRLLTKLGAERNAREVHALYLGALTSTSFRLGPQQLLDQVLGDGAVMGENEHDANEAIQTLFGYWNHLIDERRAGRVHLAPAELPKVASKKELLAFATLRHNELEWYVRGIDAGGDDPLEFGADGKDLLEGIGESTGFFQLYIEMLGRDAEASPKELRDTRTNLLDCVAAAERLIAKLMQVSDTVRREALDAYAANAGAPTHDGAKIATSIKVGRNEKCPCASGKKWKKCCGAPGAVQ
jgi:hypothetical protein